MSRLRERGPGRGMAHGVPHRVFQGANQLPCQRHHALIAGIAVFPFLIDIQNGRRALMAVYMLRPPAIRMSAWLARARSSRPRGLPSSIIWASSPINSRIRSLSSSVDFLVPVATTVSPRSCRAATMDQDLTPPVYSSARLPRSRSRHGASSVSIRASSRAISASVRVWRSGSSSRRAKSRRAADTSRTP